MKRIVALALAALLVMLFICSCDNDKSKGGSGTVITLATTRSDTSSSTGTDTTTSVTFQEQSQTHGSETATSDTATTQRTIRFSEMKTGATAAYAEFTVNKVLTPSQLKIYHNILNAVKAHTSLLDLGDVSTFDILYAYNAVNKYNPALFWFPLKYELIRYSGGYNLRLHYQYTAEQVSGMSTKTEAAAAQLLASVPDSTDEYLTALRIYEALCTKVSYDESLSDESFNIYGALVNGNATCEGYSRTYQYLLSMRGIKALLVSGKVGNEGHMWNRVCVNGKWYNTDVTLGDSDDTINHFYFNRTDAEFLSDHTCDRTISSTDGVTIPYSMEYNMPLPVCTANSDSYYSKNGGFIDSEENLSSVVTALIKKNKGAAGIYEFGFAATFGGFPESGSAKYEKLKSKIVAAVRAASDRTFSFYGVSGGAGFAVRLK